jgi:hypothetical protein
MLRRALDIQTRSQGESHPSRLLTAYLLADTVARAGRQPEAFDLAEGFLAQVRADDASVRLRFQGLLADVTEQRKSEQRAQELVSRRDAVSEVDAVGFLDPDDEARISRDVGEEEVLLPDG